MLKMTAYELREALLDFAVDFVKQVEEDGYTLPDLEDDLDIVEDYVDNFMADHGLEDMDEQSAEVSA